MPLQLSHSPSRTHTLAVWLQSVGGTDPTHAWYVRLSLASQPTLILSPDRFHFSVCRILFSERRCENEVGWFTRLCLRAVPYVGKRLLVCTHPVAMAGLLDYPHYDVLEDVEFKEGMKKFS